jgi:hypothetical protein
VLRSQMIHIHALGDVETCFGLLCTEYKQTSKRNHVSSPASITSSIARLEPLDEAASRRRGAEGRGALTQVVHEPTTACTSSRTLVAATATTPNTHVLLCCSTNRVQVQVQNQVQATTGLSPGVYQVALPVAPDTLHRCVGVAWGALICFPPNGGGALITFAHHAQHPRDV